MLDSRAKRSNVRNTWGKLKRLQNQPQALRVFCWRYPWFYRVQLMFFICSSTHTKIGCKTKSQEYLIFFHSVTNLCMSFKKQDLFYGYLFWNLKVKYKTFACLSVRLFSDTALTHWVLLQDCKAKPCFKIYQLTRVTFGKNNCQKNQMATFAFKVLIIALIFTVAYCILNKSLDDIWFCWKYQQFFEKKCPFQLYLWES